MNWLTLSVFGVFVLICATEQIIKNPDIADRIVRIVKESKNKQYWEEFKKLLQEYQRTGSFMFFISQEWHFSDFGWFLLLVGSRPENPPTEAKQALCDFFKATLPEGSNPSDEAVAELAKQYSKIVREKRLGYKNMVFSEAEHMQLTDYWMATGVLEKIVAEHRIKAQGNDFVKIFEDENVELAAMAKSIRDMFSSNRRDEMLSRMTVTYGVPALSPDNQFKVLFLTDEYVAHMESEENAMEAFKNFVAIAKTLKDPESYANNEALWAALSRNKVSEAYYILVKEMIKCMKEPLSNDEKKTIDEVFGSSAEIAKMVLADGEKPEAQQIRDKFVELNNKTTTNIKLAFTKLVDASEGKANAEKMMLCFMGDEERDILKLAIASDDKFFTDAQMEEMKQKNKKAYAVIFLLNEFIKGSRRRVGLSNAAATFFKEFETTPHLVLYLTHSVFPSDETTYRLKEMRNNLIPKFNSLDVEVKKEIAKKLPYRTVFVLSSLN